MLSSVLAGRVRLAGRGATALVAILTLSLALTSAIALASRPSDHTFIDPSRPGAAHPTLAPGFGHSASGLLGGEPRPLVRVKVTSPEGWELLRSMGAELYLRGDEDAIVRLHLEDLPSLGAHGLSWMELSRDIPSPLYLLVPGVDSPPVSSLDVLLLDKEGEGAVVSADPQAALMAISRGYKAIPLDGTLPILASGFLGLEFVNDVVITDDRFAHLASRVSPDTLRSMIQRLQNYGTRHTDSQQVQRAAHWLRSRLEGFGYNDAYIQGVKAGKIQIATGNVVATRTGSAAPHFHIVVGGHYDSNISSAWGDPTVTAPGADDNASGTAGTLEVARILAGFELDATVHYVLFAAEEQGLYGSQEFAAQLVRDGVPAHEAFCINMDMIGNEDSPQEEWEVQIYSNTASLPLAGLFGRVSNAYAGLAPVIVGPSSFSDHFPFNQRGYPAIFVHEGDSNYKLHTPNDLLMHLEMDYAAEVVRSVLATVLHLAKVAEPPDAVMAYEAASGELHVEWNHSADADVVGYYVELVDDSGELLLRQSSTENHASIDSRLLQSSSWVRVVAEDVLGESEPSEPILVGAGELIAIGATPNPATDRCQFDIFIPGSGGPTTTTLRIVDAAGRLVRTVSDQPLPRGSHSLEWDTAFANGNAVPEGVYFYLLEINGVGSMTGKIMVVR